MISFITVVTLIVLFILGKMFKVIHMREAAIKETLGKYSGLLTPGLHFLWPFMDRIAYRHEMREQVMDVPPQICITRDNVQVEVDGVVYLKVMDPVKASYGIGDYRLAAVSLAQTTMRSEVGKLTLDHTFSEREAINENIVKEIDKASESWGVKMIRYEIRNITPSKKMIETMEKQMEAERQKRAEITRAGGEKDFRINISTGERQEAINLSEGEKQKRINEAMGKAKEIELIANATANGTRRIATAINKPGGQQAIRMRVVEQFIEEFGRVVGNARVSVVPAQLAALRGLMESLTSAGQGGGTQRTETLAFPQDTTSAPTPPRLPRGQGGRQ